MGSERRRGLRDRHAEHQPDLGTSETEDAPRQPCRERFAHDQGSAETDRESDRGPNEHHLGVEQQTNRHEERRDEERVTEEVGHLHQRAGVGHNPVEAHPNEERTDQRLDPNQFGNHG